MKKREVGKDQRGRYDKSFVQRHGCCCLNEDKRGRMRESRGTARE